MVVGSKPSRRQMCIGNGKSMNTDRIKVVSQVENTEVYVFRGTTRYSQNLGQNPREDSEPLIISITRYDLM